MDDKELRACALIWYVVIAIMVAGIAVTVSA